jgi:L-alanine-DL-glutamate epimerase-like enolase superfamily enzyme
MMLGEYQSAIATVVDSLSTENLDEAVNMATSAMEVRGFEDLKLQRGEVFLEDLRRYLAGVTN